MVYYTSTKRNFHILFFNPQIFCVNPDTKQTKYVFMAFSEIKKSCFILESKERIKYKNNTSK